ncbi:MAG TPA: Gldg family protein [Polyangia bacterium]|jgi:hypothetical protein|nr:Gldg family protein [Polyangia bacterium]
METTKATTKTQAKTGMTDKRTAGQANNLVLSILLGAGLFAVFVGERLIGAGPWRGLTGLGVALVTFALVARAVRATRPGEHRHVEQRLLILYGLAALALLLYFAQSDLLAVVTGRLLERGSPKLAGALAALWPALLLAAALPILLVEMAYAAMARAPRLENGRLDDAILTGLALAGALVFAFSMTYVATQRDHKVDLSYFRTARAGESTRKVARLLDKPVDVALFFPPANEVQEQVASYFSDLQAQSKFVQVKTYDYAVDVGKAKELGVSGNGAVVIYRDKQREQMPLGIEIESARGQLATLDRDAQRAILKVARPSRTIYFTAGHGERSPDPASDTDKRSTIRNLRELLTQQGNSVRDLGAAEGLAAEVPSDANAVFILGPQKPFLPEELASLERYRKRGGRLLVALDPDGQDLHEMLGPLGLKFVSTPLANDQVFARKSFQTSDRANLVTGSFSSHPSVTALSQLGFRAPLILVGAGHLEDVGKRPEGMFQNPIVYSHPATFEDANNNFNFDAPGEQRRAWTLGTTLSRPSDRSHGVAPDKAGEGKGKADEGKQEEERIVILADSDIFVDGVVGNPGNVYLVNDVVKWLLGDEAISGEINSEVDVPVAHTRKDDVMWFYGSILLAPAFVLGLGYMATRRRRSWRKAGTGAAA